MTMYYLVYLPSAKIMFVSNLKENCMEEYKKIGHDYDEDYRVMTDTEFLEMVKRIYTGR